MHSTQHCKSSALYKSTCMPCVTRYSK
uniref:Uncharacterized protein n=1 Tax=Arundo donax TaxID=35708 RepID=A0A0A8Z152_ARUDO